MANEISLYPGRLKKFNLQWRQGGASGPVLDTTGATFSVIRNSLPGVPTITPVDESQGQYVLTFEASTTQGLKTGSFFSLVVALTMPGAEAGYSPDPLTIQGVIL